MNRRHIPNCASEWLMELKSRPDDVHLKHAFESWRAANSDNARDWTETSRIYELAAQIPAKYRDQWENDTTVTSSSPQVSSVRSIKPLSAVLALAATLAVFVGLSNQLIGFANMGADLSTVTAEIKTVELIDGSVMQLAPESALDIEYEMGERRVHLREGTAFFDVRPDQDRPFVVQIEGVRIKVVGTGFEVRKIDDSVHVAVQNGVVEVRGSETRVNKLEILRQGDWVRVGTSGHSVRGSKPPGQIASWRQGQVIARDHTVGDVINKIRPYYRGLIILKSKSLAAQPLNGIYNLKEPLGALKAIASAQNAQITQISPWVVILGDQ